MSFNCVESKQQFSQQRADRVNLTVNLHMHICFVKLIQGNTDFVFSGYIKMYLCLFVCVRAISVLIEKYFLRIC